MDTIRSHKVVLLGDSTVGKTCLAHRMKFNNFMLCPDSTIGCEFFAHTVESSEGKLKLLIWDTAGQEVFRSFTPQFLRGAVLVVIAYDSSVPIRQCKIENWIKMVPEDAIILIVPTKSDLPSAAAESDRLDSLESKSPIYFAESTSAKTGQNVDVLLERMVQVLQKHNPSKHSEPRIKYVDMEDEEKRLLDCCAIQ